MKNVVVAVCSLSLCFVFLGSVVFAGGKVATSGIHSCAITPSYDVIDFP